MPLSGLRETSYRASVSHGITAKQGPSATISRGASSWPESTVERPRARRFAFAACRDSSYDDYTVMEISGHSSTRMLARYTHPTDARKIGALTVPRVSTQRAQSDVAGSEDLATPAEISEMLRENWWTAGGSNSRPPRCERARKATVSGCAVTT